MGGVNHWQVALFSGNRGRDGFILGSVFIVIYMPTRHRLQLCLCGLPSQWASGYGPGMLGSELQW